MHIAFFFLALSYTVPIVGQPWISAQNEALGFICVLMLGIHTVKNKIIKVKLNAPIYMLLIMQGALCLQFLLGRVYYTGDFVNWTLYLLASCMCIVIGGAGSTEGGSSGCALCIKLAITILIASLISSLIALVQGLNLYLDSEWIVRTISSRAGSNLGQPNHLATLCAMGLVSLIYVTEKLNIKRWAAYAMAMLLIFALVLSVSRTGIIELVLISGGGYLFFKRNRRTPVMNPIYLMAMYWVSWMIWQTWSAQNGSGSNIAIIPALGSSPGTRACVWLSLYESGLTRFWFGWGLGQVYAAQKNIAHIISCGDSYTYAHNIILELFVGLGAVGLVLSISFGVWFIKTIKNAGTIEEGYCIGVIASVLVHSLLEFPYAYAYLLFPVMILMGRLNSIQNPIKENERSIPRFSILAAWIAITLTGLIWCSDYFRLQEEFRRARFEMLKIGQIDRDHRSAPIYLLTQLGEAIDAMHIVPTQQITSEQLQILNRASERFPWPVLATRYATALALRNEVNAAVRQLKIIRSIYGDHVLKGLVQKWQQGEDVDLIKFNVILEKFNE